MDKELKRKLCKRKSSDTRTFQSLQPKLCEIAPPKHESREFAQRHPIGVENKFDELCFGDGFLRFFGQNLLAKARQSLEFRRRFHDTGKSLPPPASLASSALASAAAAAASTAAGMGTGGAHSFAKKLLGLR